MTYVGSSASIFGLLVPISKATISHAAGLARQGEQWFKNQRLPIANAWRRFLHRGIREPY